MNNETSNNFETGITTNYIRTIVGVLMPLFQYLV